MVSVMSRAVCLAQLGQALLNRCRRPASTVMGLALPAALAMSAAIGVPALTGTATASTARTARSDATQVSVTVRGIDRHGQSVSMAYQVTAVSLTGGQSYSSDGQGVLTIPAGTYAIGAAILTDGSGGQPASRTLDAQIVRARRSITVTLDARAGRLVDVSLSQPGSRPKWIDSSLCVSAGGGVELARDQGWGTVAPTPLYVVPASDSRISFGFVNDWQDGAGVQYFLSGGSKAGIPAKPDYSFSRSSLARLTLQTKAGEALGSGGYWDLSNFTACDPHTVALDFESHAVPSQVTQYVSPGPVWATFLASYSLQSNWTLVGDYKAGHSYTAVIGAAVRGPEEYLPEYAPAGSVKFPLTSLFSDPIAAPDQLQCCADGVVTLKLGSRLVRRLAFTDGGEGPGFSSRLRGAGWYSLTVNASYDQPPVPGAVLSSQVSLLWRFHVSAGDLLANGRGLPVSLTRFLPSGLDASNDAVPGADTPVRLDVVRAGLQSTSTPQYKLRTVALQISVDDGKTWQSVPVSARRGYWLATVHDPASGFVSLRCTVTDVKGNSTVETIVRAYGVS